MSSMERKRLQATAAKFNRINHNEVFTRHSCIIDYSALLVKGFHGERQPVSQFLCWQRVQPMLQPD